MRAEVRRFTMAHPGDVSALAAAIDRGEVTAASIVAIIGKTEGNGGVNDFTRGYFTQSLMLMLSGYLGEPAESLKARLPCVLSGGTEGVLSPHYVVFMRVPDASDARPPAGGFSLAVGTAFSDPLPAEAVGRAAQVRSVAQAVQAAMRDAGLVSASEVQFVQVKCPCVTSERAADALARGASPRTSNPGRSMAYARAAGAFGVALALGERTESDLDESAMLEDFSVQSSRASISSGVEVVSNEVIVLGNSSAWSGPLLVSCHVMQDALDIAGVTLALEGAGIHPSPQVSGVDRARIRGVFVKCEPDRRGRIAGNRHTMLDDTDIDAQRHIRGALGGLVSGVIGDNRIFVSGGAEHQGPDGGGLLAVVAER